MVLVYSVIHYIRFLLVNLEFWKTVLSKLEKKNTFNSFVLRKTEP